MTDLTDLTSSIIRLKSEFKNLSTLSDVIRVETKLIMEENKRLKEKLDEVTKIVSPESVIGKILKGET